ncbi:hypothetical protein [Massilia niabensis]|uniref:Methyl-accepting chemotaxis protein n=1 Tax=Massilia niabensis TaxID=544910 RepID=A0ABW0KZG1_9BURK
MAASWLRMLKAVPWSEVIAAAPQVAGSARRLWETVGRRGAPEPGIDLGEAMAHAPIDEDVAILAARIEQQDATIAQLHGQVREATKVITELADQNAQLVARMQAARERLSTVTLVAAGSALLSVISLAIVLART